jgi:hypothetical protein
VSLLSSAMRSDPTVKGGRESCVRRSAARM